MKLLIILSSAEKEKALTGLMYSRNVLKNKRFDEVKIIYFGPIEKLMTTDVEVANAAIEVSSLCDSYACRAISDKQGISEKISDMGVKIEYVGSIICDFINSGYVPMVW